MILLMVFFQEMEKFLDYQTQETLTRGGKEKRLEN